MPQPIDNIAADPCAVIASGILNIHNCSARGISQSEFLLIKAACGISGGGGAPSGPAEGDLSGTYPNPTVAMVAGRTPQSTGLDLLEATSPSNAANIIGLGNAMITDDNLAGLADIPTALTNLGLDGTLAVQNPALVTIIGGEISGTTVNRAIITRTASHQLVDTDAFVTTLMDVASANNLTVPTHVTVPFLVGCEIPVVQWGEGRTTIVAAVGVTINPSSTLKIDGQYGSATLKKIATNTWLLVGKIKA
jgi:hypothetical protein